MLELTPSEMRRAIWRWAGIDDAAFERQLQAEAAQLRQAEIAAGKLRIGTLGDWYASIRWSDQAFGIVRGERGPYVLLEPVWDPLKRC